jgi:hypothetical protein
MRLPHAGRVILSSLALCAACTLHCTAQPAERTVLFEEFTGEWCSLCPAGAIEMERALQAFAGRVIPVTYHNDDPLEARDFDAMLDSIPLDPLYPGGTFDRIPYGIKNPKHKMAVDSRDFLSTLALAAARPAHATIRAEITVDRVARRLSVTPRVVFLAADTGDFRIQCIVTENDVRRDNVQRNAFDKDSATYPQLFGAGDPLRSWEQQHVARAMLGGPAGRADAVPRMPDAGTEYSTEFTWTIPGQVDIDKLGVAVYLARYERGSLVANEVLNAEGYLAADVSLVWEPPAAGRLDLQVYPNPCVAHATLHFSSTAGAAITVALFDRLGRRMSCPAVPLSGDRFRLDLSHLPSGTYFLHCTGARGIATRVLVKR